MGEAGFSIGKYEIEEELGRGGMGVVYRARQTDLERPVALKLILASRLGTARQVELFRAEAQAAARVRHPNVVAIYEAGSVLGQHYLAMEYVPGSTLDESLSRKSFEPERAAALLATIARAVEALHASGIVHRDLKPSNILLDGEGRPFITDFGLAKVQRGPEESDASGSLRGTPAYMAPEQILGGGEGVGPRTDVYALGLLLYELLTGRRAFGGGETLDVLVAVTEGEPPRARAVAPRTPRELERVLQRCMEKDPDDRYPSAAAVAEDLERYLAGEPVEAGGGRWAEPLRRLRHWVRRHPALGARLVGFLVFDGITAGNLWAGSVDTAFFGRVSAILLAWAVGSVLFDRRVESGTGERGALYGWIGLDAVALTAVLLLADGVSSPLVNVYLLLLASSALWMRLALVHFAALGVLASYALLVADSLLRRTQFARPLDHHLILVASVLILWAVVAQLVRRARSLSSYAS